MRRRTTSSYVEPFSSSLRWTPDLRRRARDIRPSFAESVGKKAQVLRVRPNIKWGQRSGIESLSLRPKALPVVLGYDPDLHHWGIALDVHEWRLAPSFNGRAHLGHDCTYTLAGEEARSAATEAASKI